MKASKRISQKTRILAALKKGKWITQKDAICLWECYRLASRITELKAEGWNIKTVLMSNGSNGGRHAQYYLGRPHRVGK